MASKVNCPILCVLLLYFLQLSLPVQAVTCGTGTCEANGVCDRDVCYCNPNYAGPSCATPTVCSTACTDEQTCTDTDTCSPCKAECKQASGTCHAVGTAAKCKCPPTHTGDDCEFACSAITVPCTIYQQCQEGTGAAECGCKGGLTGVGCKEGIDCTKGQPCMHGGSCATDRCNCETSHVGTICQHACAPLACTTLQTCVAKTDDSAAECKCKPGLDGDSCTTVACDPTDPCENGGTCSTNKCNCPTTAVGTICQHPCPTCATGKVCTEKADKTGAECTDGASSMLVTWTVLILGVWSATKLY